MFNFQWSLQKNGSAFYLCHFFIRTCKLRWRLRCCYFWFKLSHPIATQNIMPKMIPFSKLYLGNFNKFFVIFSKNRKISLDVLRKLSLSEVNSVKQQSGDLSMHAACVDMEKRRNCEEPCLHFTSIFNNFQQPLLNKNFLRKIRKINP